MMTQSFRCAAAGLVAISSTVLWAAAPAEVEKAAENLAQPEHRAPAMEEVLSIGKLVTPFVDMEQFEAQLREQTRKLTERLNAAIENELRELAVPKLDIEVAGPVTVAALRLPAAG